jgi:hypothetical protein
MNTNNVIGVTEFIRDALLRVDQIKAKCEQHFIPQVCKLLEWEGKQHGITLEFIEAMPQVNGLRYEMQIPLDGLDVYDLRTVCNNLKCLTSWEPEDEEFSAFDMHGYAMSMGDGDDSNAVYMRNGKLCVWVRGWRNLGEPE